MKYKVSVRKGIGRGDWKESSHVIFEISLDNKHYRGDHFRSILDWAESNFKELTIIVCDTLQRHNLMFSENINEQEAQVISKERGDHWLDEYSPYMESKAIPTQIYRWDKWLFCSQQYEKGLESLKTLYSEDINFQRDLQAFFEKVFERKAKLVPHIWDIKTQYIESVLMPYFFEETVVTSIFLEDIKGISAYPGTLPKLWEKFIQRKFVGLEGFLNHTFLTLDLVKRKPSSKLY